MTRSVGEATTQEIRGNNLPKEKSNIREIHKRFVDLIIAHDARNDGTEQYEALDKRQALIDISDLLGDIGTLNSTLVQIAITSTRALAMSAHKHHGTIRPEDMETICNMARAAIRWIDGEGP